jgi:hypothetical protein
MDSEISSSVPVSWVSQLAARTFSETREKWNIHLRSVIELGGRAQWRQVSVEIDVGGSERLSGFGLSKQTLVTL